MKNFEKMDILLQNYLKKAKTFDGKPVKEKLDALDLKKIWIGLNWYWLASGKYLTGWFDDKKENDRYFDLDMLELYYILKKYKMLYVYNILDVYNEYECNKKKQSKEKNLKALKKIKNLLRKNYEDGIKAVVTYYFFEDLNSSINSDYFINEYHKIDNGLWLLDYYV